MKQTCSAGSADYYTSTTATAAPRASACWRGWAAGNRATARDGRRVAGCRFLDRRCGADDRAPTRGERYRRRETMTYVVTENCIKCKYMDCVEVCPVDCF